MKRYSTSLVVRKMQIKTTKMKYHFISRRIIIVFVKCFIYLLLLSLLLLFAMLRIKSRTASILGKYSVTELHAVVENNSFR